MTEQMSRLRVGHEVRVDSDMQFICRKKEWIGRAPEALTTWIGTSALKKSVLANRARWPIQEPPVIEAVYPFQGCKLDGFDWPPWSVPMDDLGLVEAVDRFGESIVVAVADAADGGLDAGLRQALGVLDRDVLGCRGRCDAQAAAMDGPPIMESLLQHIKHKARVCCP
jgi:hypothetical protein